MRKKRVTQINALTAAIKQIERAKQTYSRGFEREPITITTEEKARRYDEAIIRAKSLIGDTIINESGQHIAEVIFPELKKEDEDERIRKALIRYHKSTIDIDGIKGKDIIAWLEKLKK